MYQTIMTGIEGNLYIQTYNTKKQAEKAARRFSCSLYTGGLAGTDRKGDP